MVNSPVVSIILPTYNGKKEWISESIDSVLSQTFEDFELIIINDASTNDIEETIFKYKNQDSRVVYLKNEKNLNLTNTLNKGIKYAKGKYIARIDDDDIWLSKDKLGKQVRFMEDNLDYGLCGVSYISVINEEGRKIKEVELVCEDDEIRNVILGYVPFFHSGVIIRKSILNVVGTYNPRYNKAEDYELWCRIGLKSKLKNLNNIKIYYRINGNGICMNNKYYQWLLYIKICVIHRNNYPRFYRGLIFKILEFLLPKNSYNIYSNILRKTRTFFGKNNYKNICFIVNLIYIIFF